MHLCPHNPRGRRLAVPAFLGATRSIEPISYGNVAGWLAGWVGGWLSCHSRYCIKTTEPILKLFGPSGSPIILVFWSLVPMTNSKGNPVGRGVKHTGVGKIGDFRLKSPYVVLFIFAFIVSCPVCLVFYCILRYCVSCLVYVCYMCMAASAK